MRLCLREQAALVHNRASKCTWTSLCPRCASKCTAACLAGQAHLEQLGITQQCSTVRDTMHRLFSKKGSLQVTGRHAHCVRMGCDWRLRGVVPANSIEMYFCLWGTSKAGHHT